MQTNQKSLKVWKYPVTRGIETVVLFRNVTRKWAERVLWNHFKAFLLLIRFNLQEEKICRDSLARDYISRFWNMEMQGALIYE